MKHNFETALAEVFRHEGGYADHPDDPGGATNMGITHRTLAAWRGKAAVTRDEVRSLTRSEAAQIYRENYWDAVSGDDLPSGVDLCVFDFAVNAGVSRSSKFLQKIIGADQDGDIGPATLKLAAEWPADALIEAFHEARMDHYRSLSIWPTFKNGWTKRANSVWATALSIIGHATAADDAPDGADIGKLADFFEAVKRVWAWVQSSKRS